MVKRTMKRILLAAFVLALTVTITLSEEHAQKRAHERCLEPEVSNRPATTITAHWNWFPPHWECVYQSDAADGPRTKPTPELLEVGAREALSKIIVWPGSRLRSDSSGRQARSHVAWARANGQGIPNEA